MLAAKLSCALAALVLTSVAPLAPAAIITYDGSVTPDHASLGNTWRSVLFGGTNWSASGGVLTLTTAPFQGIWFGNSGTQSWPLGSNAVGNTYHMRARLGSPTSDEWGVYLYDGAAVASFYLYPGHFTYTVPAPGNPAAAQTLSFPTNTNVFHDFSFTLKGNRVVYAFDNFPLYDGPAFLTGGNILVIGDGSGSSYGTNGSFQIDSLSIDTAPTIFVPEPTSLATLLTLTSLLACRRRQP